MKTTEKNITKEKTSEITTKELPFKLKMGKSMIEKFEYAKAVSASIKGFKDAK